MGMSEKIPNGSRKDIGGRPYIHYDGYWIKYYAPPADSLSAKKNLIGALTRRLFNHVEHGINIPGRRLDDARRHYDEETDPELKRVKGAMLAGALFNRAGDIFTHLVELQELGVQIETDNSLMRECGNCLIEALQFGRDVRHRSGEESIDELWGEPFKAFSIPVEAFYESRYIKIAQTMTDIDQIAKVMTAAYTATDLFPGAGVCIQNLAEAAKRKTETLRTDADIFDVWPAFVVAAERLCLVEPQFPMAPSKAVFRLADEGKDLLEQGKNLLTHIARARVPMRKTTREYLARCEIYHDSLLEHFGRP